MARIADMGMRNHSNASMVAMAGSYLFSTDYILGR